jgi:hypothetical protein
LDKRLSVPQSCSVCGGEDKKISSLMSYNNVSMSKYSFGAGKGSKMI